MTKFPHLMESSPCSSSLEHRWGFLVPWCEQLKGNIHYGRFAVKGGVWDTQRSTLHVVVRRDLLNTESEENFQIKLRFIREALALLAAVEHEDYEAWRYLLIVHCGIDVGKEGEEKFDDKIPVKFMLCLDWEARKSDDSEGTSNYDLVKFCGVDQRVCASGDYLETLAKIAALGKHLHPTRRGVDIQVPVQVFFSTDRVKAMNTSAEELVAAGEAYNLILKQWSQYKESQTVPSGSLRSTLKLEPPIADFLGMKLSPRMIATLDKLAQDNLGFSQVKRVRLELTQDLWDDALESKRAFGQLFTALFNGGTASVGSLMPTLGPAHIGSLQLFCPATMPVADFVALASSLVLNQTVKNLELRYVSQSHVQLTTCDWWKWLAYSVFSQRTRATSVLESIEIVKLHSMTTADMAVLTEVLAAEHPEEKLFGSPCRNFQEKSATIKAGASLIWQFNFRGEPVRGVPLLTLESPIESARVFSDDGVSEWVGVMVPGYGHCRVQRDSVEFDAFILPEVTPQLLDLKLEFVKTRNAITAGLPLFLAAVGSSLRNLTLVVRNLELTINEILESCPNLAELSLTVDTIDVQLQFSRSHELGQPFSESGSFVWNDPVAVANALSDDCNSLSSCVYRMRAHPGDADAPVGLSIIFDALLNMLACNSTLKFFEVAVPVQYDGYCAKFRTFHLQPTRHTSKLPLEAKIAFISLVSPLVGVSRTSQYQSPIRELDTDVLCKIFAFAVSPVLRHVFAAAYHG